MYCMSEYLNPVLAPISSPIAHYLGLTRLPDNSSAVLLSFLTFHLVQWSSPYFFNRWFPEYYGNASERVKQGWAARACSMVHAITVVILAYRCIYLPELDNDRVFGTHPSEETMAAFACGFLWDVMEETVVHFQDIGLALHGLVVLLGISLTFQPLFAYTCVRFLFLEISTPFLNIQWFLDKTGRTGSTFQLANGIALILVFFATRICYGTIAFSRFFVDLYGARALIPQPLLIIYAFGTAALQVLNCIWMYKMLIALRKRFPSQKSKAG